MFKIIHQQIIGYIEKQHNRKIDKDCVWYQENGTIVVRFKTVNDVPGAYIGTFPMDDMLHRLCACAQEGVGPGAISLKSLTDKVDFYSNKMSVLRHANYGNFLTYRKETEVLFKHFPHIKTWIYEWIIHGLEKVQPEESLFPVGVLLLLNDEEQERELTLLFNQKVYEQKRPVTKLQKRYPIQQTLFLSSKEYVNSEQEWHDYGWDIVCSPLILFPFDKKNERHCAMIHKSIQYNVHWNYGEMRSWKDPEWSFFLAHLDWFESYFNTMSSNVLKSIIIATIQSGGQYPHINMEPFVMRYIPNPEKCMSSIREAQVEYMIQGKINKSCYSHYFNNNNNFIEMEEETLML